MKIVIFTGAKNRCMLHGRVFVMPQRQNFSQHESIYMYMPDLSLSLSSVISPDIQMMAMLRRHRAVITDIVRKTFRKHHRVQELLSLCSISFTVFFLLKIKQTIIYLTCLIKSKTYSPPIVLVIPRKRWLRPNMTEKLFTGTLSIKTQNPRSKTDLYA